MYNKKIVVARQKPRGIKKERYSRGAAKTAPEDHPARKVDVEDGA